MDMCNKEIGVINFSVRGKIICGNKNEHNTNLKKNENLALGFDGNKLQHSNETELSIKLTQYFRM